MITVLATIIVLGILIFFHELGHFLVAKLLGVRVEAFSLGFPPKLLHKKIGDTDYRLSVVPLGGYVKLLGENPNDQVPSELIPYSFMHHPLWHRVVIVLAGPVFNLVFAVLALFLVFTFSGIPYLTTEIGAVMEQSPAAQAGLQKGDRVLTVDGRQVARWEELSRLIRQEGAKPLQLSVKRGEQVFTAEVKPQLMETPDIFGSQTQARIIGITASDHPAVEEVGPGKALVEGTVYTYRLSYLTVVSLGKLLAREVPLKSLGGPILIAQVAGKQAKLGVAALVQFMAVLSVNLFLLNLLPIPILDGGHLLFFVIEALRGKPVEIKHREMAQGVGLMIILALMILVFYQDIVRLVNPTP
jgi:regulator of sigma E protease